MLFVKHIFDFSQTAAQILMEFGSYMHLGKVTQVCSRSLDSMTASLTWQVYGPGVEAHNYGYSRRTLARLVSIDS